MSLLALDIGSSSCKAVAFTSAGKILAQHSCSYTPYFPQPCHAEMDPSCFWNAFCDCARHVGENLASPVQALSLSSHGETFMPVNQAGEAIGPAILNQDNRATHETDWIEKRLGHKRIFEITGLVAHPMYPLPKLLWLREHQPDLFSSAARFVSVIGYILGRLGAPPYEDYSLASRYLAFDVRQHRWSEELLEAADLDANRLPVAVPAGTVAGKLNGSAASQLGLPSGTPLVLGGHDQPCGALGVGVIKEGQAADSIGTYECVLVASDKPVLSGAALESALNSYCHVVPDKFVTIAYFPSGIMVKWFHDLLYGHDNAASTESDHYAYLEANAPEDLTGLYITPHLFGTCSPDFNPKARGMIYGLSAGTGRAEIYKGVLEGLACELSLVTKLLTDAAGDFQDMHVSGGGTRSALGLKLRAALTGKRLHVMQSPEAVCLGGAILAGVAVGEYKNVEEAVRAMVREATVIEPNAQLAGAYAEQLKRYQFMRTSLSAWSKED
jgi:xylulokinase